ncbi:MAG: hypothetical protein U0T81_00525 [Saprospiraceae bacterium]
MPAVALRIGPEDLGHPLSDSPAGLCKRLGRIVNNLIKSKYGKVPCHELHNWSKPVHGGPNPNSPDPNSAMGIINDASGAKFVNIPLLTATHCAIRLLPPPINRTLGSRRISSHIPSLTPALLNVMTHISELPQNYSFQYK